MQLDRYGTGKISGWQAAMVLVPLWGVAILGIGGALILFAMHGKWAAFAILLAAEIGGLVMIVRVWRSSSRRDSIR
jgi:hypothetical protein